MKAVFRLLRESLLRLIFGYTEEGGGENQALDISDG